MRLLVIGQAAFGQEVLTKLREAGEEVVAVAAPGMSRSGRADRLAAAAEQAGIVTIETGKLGEAENVAKLKELKPELGVMVYVSDLIPTEVVNLPSHGTI